MIPYTVILYLYDADTEDGCHLSMWPVEASGPGNAIERALDFQAAETYYTEVRDAIVIYGSHADRTPYPAGALLRKIGYGSDA